MIVAPSFPKSIMGAPTVLLRSCLAKMASGSVFAAPVHEVCMGCGKKFTAGFNLNSRRARGNSPRWGQFKSVVSLGFPIPQQHGQARASSPSQARPEPVRAQRKSKASRTNRTFVTGATEEIAQDCNSETDGQDVEDDADSGDDEMEEVLEAMSSSIGLTGTGTLSGASSSSVCVGIDPDLSGAIAVLKSRDNRTVAEVIDVPCVTVAVNKRLRRRHDYESIAAIVKELQAPEGSIAYVEQAMPFPKDGKQGWYITGYGYGVWLGILATAGFTVIPVRARAWKTAMGICGKEFTKDDSRAVASSLFPALSGQFRRKKDHGRADALLIAAFGKGMTFSKDAEPFGEPRSSDKVELLDQSTVLTETYVVS